MAIRNSHRNNTKQKRGNIPTTKLIKLALATLFIAFVTTFNYGGCGGGGSSSGSSAPPAQSAPLVTTNPATDCTRFTATLNGTVNPKGVKAFVCFQYGETISYSSTTNYQDIGSGTSDINVSANIIGLAENTLYNFRVVVTNANGTTYGNNLTFATGAPFGSPSTCTTNPASSIGPTFATLNGSVNPNGTNVTSCYFDYGTQPISYGLGQQNIAQPLPLTGKTSINVSAAVSSLLLYTTYNFRVVGTNTYGTTYGNNLTFTTAVPPAPTCTTNAATNITYNSARLNGTVNPNGADTTAYFQYTWGTGVLQYAPTYTITTTAQAIGSGTTGLAVNVDISGLSSSTQYNFRVVGTNSSGTTDGNNRRFTTGGALDSAPTCTTDAADNITSNSAILNGTVNPNGVATTVYFNYGLTTSYTVRTTSWTIGSGTISLAVDSTAGTLTPNTLYNFRVVGTSTAGTTYGNNLTFTTIVEAPDQVGSPSPADGATGIPITTSLSWASATGATSYDVYFGISNPPPYRANQTGTSYNPGTLSYSTFYYWIIDSKNSGGTITGNLWSFTTLSSGSQNDMSTGGDAGNNIAGATIINGPTSGTGQLSDTDTNDYYKVTVSSATAFDVSLTSPSGTDFDLYLYCPQTTDRTRYVLRSINPAGQLDSLSFGLNSTAIIRIYRFSGSGTYTLSITSTSNPNVVPPDPPNSIPTIFIPADSSNFTVRSSRTINRVVNHTTEGTLYSTVNWFTNSSAGVSSHYTIGNDGAVVQMVKDNNIAYHAGNWWYNERSIGIEHEGYANQSATWTDQIKQSSVTLTLWLANTYSIVKTRQFIVGHNEIPRQAEYTASTYKTDPGIYFDWDWYMGQIGGTSTITFTPVKITTTTLNVRTGPTTSASLLNVNVYQDQVYVSTYQENGWYLIFVGGHPGWISGTYATPQTSGAGIYIKPDTSLVPVRDAEAGNIIGQALYKNVYWKVGQSGNWYTIYYRGTIRYITADSTYTQELSLPYSLPFPP